MIITNSFFKVFSLCLLLNATLVSFAVTQKEMEEARTIAAKAYIRYANDGSGYLDEINPKTMAELEAALKPKEKENIKAFKAIAIPSDYKDWGKERLVEYWAVEAFKDKGLQEKGRGGRLRARSQINKMSIAAPQEASSSSSSLPEATVENKNTNVETTDSTLNQFQTDAVALSLSEVNEDADLNVDKAENYTWVYIMILGILVAIVVALVVYASNVFKKTNRQEQYRQREEESEATEQFESQIADKDVEIAMLKKKLDSALKHNAELKAKLDSLTAEMGVLKEAASVVTKPTTTNPETKPAPRTPLRSIFLGRANARGIFVRADKSLNPGHSVYILDTSDGFSGSFRVADSPAAWSLALSNPAEYLETACTGHELDDTAGATRILTESSGTAVFEGGCWRVIRKARIRYE